MNIAQNNSSKESGIPGDEIIRGRSLKLIAKILALSGAIGALFFMFHKARNQKSVLLISMFTAWVLSPFVGFWFAIMRSGRWKYEFRKFTYLAVIIVVVGTLLAYSGTLTPPGTRLTFLFLLVPLISLLLIFVLLMMASRSGNT